MKEAILTDLDGRYIEPTLVADSVTGVFDRREPIEGEPSEPEPELVGYTVAIRPPDGLYQPTFDVAGYRKAQEEYEVAYAKYEAELAKRNSEGEPDTDKEPLPDPPQQVDGTSFWRNGLTDEEIAEFHEKCKPEPSPLEYLGKLVVESELEVLELRKQNEAAGAVIVDTELRILERMEANSNV